MTIIHVLSIQGYKGSGGRFYDMEEPLLPVNWPLTALGAILLLVGFLWVTGFKKNDKASMPGCLIMGVGGLLLFPLLTWIFAGIRILVGVVIGIVVLAFIAFGIYSIFKK